MAEQLPTKPGQRSAGRFLRDAIRGWSLGVYAARSRPHALRDGTWADRIGGIVARQRGRRDHASPNLAFSVAMNDIDDLLTLFLSALYEEAVHDMETNAPIRDEDIGPPLSAYYYDPEA